MRSGWKHFAAFAGFEVLLVVAATWATWGEPRSAMLVLAQVGFIAVASYLVTFLVWPRKALVSAAHPSRSTRPAPVPAELGNSDSRPVLVIGHRPAGSKPGSKIHVRESPTVRGSRGRRPGPRAPQEEIRWPAQR